MKLIILCILSLLSHFFTYLFGKPDFLFYSTVILFFLGQTLVFFKDYKLGTFKLKTSLLRFMKLFVYATILIITVILDHLLNMQSTIREFVLLTFLYNEITSILSISIQLGVKVPKIIPITLQKLLEIIPTETIASTNEVEKKS